MIAQLHIYTLSPITTNIKKALDFSESIFLMGGVSSDEVSKLQDYANILVHTEAFGLKEMLVARLSFSTKLVDYFYKGKCIFAVGKKESSSIAYLIKNDAAIVATDEEMLIEKLNQIINDLSIISEYEQKAWDCGKRNHQIRNIQGKLFEDLISLVKD